MSIKIPCIRLHICIHASADLRSCLLQLLNFQIVFRNDYTNFFSSQAEFFVEGVFDNEAGSIKLYCCKNVIGYNSLPIVSLSFEASFLHVTPTYLQLFTLFLCFKDFVSDLMAILVKRMPSAL